MKNWVVGVIVILLLTILALELDFKMYTFSWVALTCPLDGGFLLNSQAYT